MAQAYDSGEILGRLLQWTGAVEGFEVHHAADALVIADAFRPPSSSDPERLFLLAVPTSFWFWFDDRSDRWLQHEQSQVDYERLSSFVRTGVPFGKPVSEEELYFSRVSELLERSSLAKGEHEWWLQTAARAICGVWMEDRANRAKRFLSYSECLENGVNATTVYNLIASASLVYDLGRFRRQTDIPLYEFERCFCTYQRILNDIIGVERDRAEGRIGNLILTLSNSFAAADAERFVRDQLRGYERLLSEQAAGLGKADSLVKLIVSAQSRINEWYAASPARYEQQPEAPSGALAQG